MAGRGRGRGIDQRPAWMVSDSNPLDPQTVPLPAAPPAARRRSRFDTETATTTTTSWSEEQREFPEPPPPTFVRPPAHPSTIRQQAPPTPVIPVIPPHDYSIHAPGPLKYFTAIHPPLPKAVVTSLATTFDVRYTLLGFSCGLITLHNAATSSAPTIREYGHAPGFTHNNTPTTSLAVLAGNSQFVSTGISGCHSTNTSMCLWDVTRSGSAPSSRDNPVGALAVLTGGHTPPPPSLYLPPVTALATCPTSPDLIVSGGFDGQLLLWDVRNAKHRVASPSNRVEKLTSKGNSPQDSITQISFSNTTIAASTASGDLFIYDLRAAVCLKLHLQGSPTVTNFLFLNDDTLAVSCHDNTIRLVSTVDATECNPSQPLVVYEGHRSETASCLGMAVDKSSRFLATCSEGGEVVVYDFIEGTVMQRIAKEEGRLMVNSGGGVVVGGRGGARVYNY